MITIIKYGVGCSEWEENEETKIIITIAIQFYLFLFSQGEKKINLKRKS